ncbi:MAG: hypothetical protein JWM87_4191 [Candidatus Eremiobacteraeota bacterium]|nr:hypothetical protein [Candidatus Eremiobacteraeota bacterium]
MPHEVVVARFFGDREGVLQDVFEHLGPLHHGTRVSDDNAAGALWKSRRTNLSGL